MSYFKYFTYVLYILYIYIYTTYTLKYIIGTVEGKIVCVRTLWGLGTWALNRRD